MQEDVQHTRTLPGVGQDQVPVVDETVSRRHALVVDQAEGVRVLDDRSLNGIYVNGTRVEWSPLADGDEITVGRHTIYFIDTVSVRPAVSATPSATTE